MCVVCVWVCQVLDAMNQDSELPLTRLRVDGGMTVNETLLRLQADLLGIPVGEREGGEGGRVGGRVVETHAFVHVQSAAIPTRV